MSIAPRAMFRELETLRDRIDRLFSDGGVLPDIGEAGMLVPPIDVQEKDNEILVRATMPGINADDVDIKVDHNMLTIRGESREERDEKDGTWHVHERRFGSMYRRLPLPTPVKEEEAEATMHDGVLEIRLPKADESRSKTIKVTSV
jgi:HSP20 family protein